MKSHKPKLSPKQREMLMAAQEGAKYDAMSEKQMTATLKKIREANARSREKSGVRASRESSRSA